MSHPAMTRAELARAILDQLRAHSMASAEELAFFFGVDIAQACSVLSGLVAERKAARVTSLDGLVRYIASTAQVPTPGLSLDIHVDSAIRELDAIAQYPDAPSRARALHAIAKALNARLEQATFALLYGAPDAQEGV